MTRPTRRRRSGAERVERAFHEARRREEKVPATTEFILATCARLRPLLRSLGVEYASFRIVLEAELLLDHRRRRNVDGAPAFVKGGGLGLMMGLYLLMGVLLGALGYAFDEPYPYLVVAESAIFVLVAMPLLLDLSPVLLDTTLLDVLAPLPVSERSLLAVRAAHVLSIASLFLGSIALPPLVIGTMVFGPWPYLPAFLVATLLCAVNASCCVFLLFAVALKSLDVSRFRDALVWVQTGTFVLFYAGMQLGPRLAEKSGLLGWLEGRRDLLDFYPPAQLAVFARLFRGEGGSRELAMAAAGVGLPLLLMGWIALLSRRGMVARLMASQAGGRTGGRERPRRGLAGRLRLRMSRSPVQTAGYDFFLAMSATERAFKLRTWPMMGMLTVPIVVLMLGPADELPLATAAPYAAYLLVFIAPGIAEGARFSEDFEARWCLAHLTRAEQQEFYRGALLAMLTRYVLVPAAAVVLVSATLGGVRGAAEAVMGAGLAIAGACWLLPQLRTRLPFTAKYSMSAARPSFLIGMLAMFGAVVLGAAHYFVTLLPYGRPAGAVVGLLIAWAALRSLRTRKLRVVPLGR